MTLASDGLQSRQTDLEARIRGMVYERYQLTQRVEKIDDDLAVLSGATAANELTRKDLDTEAAIAEAQNPTETPDIGA